MIAAATAICDAATLGSGSGRKSGVPGELVVMRRVYERPMRFR